MKKSKLLNNLKFSFLIILFTSLTISKIYSNEPIDIWDLENKEDALENNSLEENSSTSIFSKKKNKNFAILSDDNLNLSKINLIGLYDPQVNNLNIDMWSNSNGDQIKSIMKKISKIKLSQDASEILEIALLTNSYSPKNQITFDEFNNYKIDFLIKKKDFDLTKKFFLSNKNIPNSQKLAKSYIDHYLLIGEIENSCEILKDIKFLEPDDYIDKFNIYCLIYDNKKDAAQIIYDLKKESGFKDNFFEEKFNFLMGYNENTVLISEKNILEFHLSHKTNNNFSYIPDNDTKKFVWKYLSNYNLLETVFNIDLNDRDKIETIEKATHENIYTEKELLSLYKRFEFSLDELLNVKKTYSNLPQYVSRALLYQRLLLTYDVNEKLFYAEKIKNSMIKDKIENAFNEELSKLLRELTPEQIPPEYTIFYESNLISDKKKEKKIKYNNKVIHQSKLINYFIKKYEIEKLSKNTNDMLKKIKNNKNYVFSNKDKILLDSIKFEGAKIKKKYDNLYVSDPNVPTDLQVLVNNNEIGMILLRLVEIIGEDNVEDLGTENLYFITTVLNQLNLDTIRDKLLIKILPLKV
tara:strand:- start:3612 stop:5351 length:1740 start_codon:yes stop_codon:yes gene_type:complete